MRIKEIFISVLITLVSVFAFANVLDPVVWAEDEEKSDYEEIDDLEDKINKYEDKVSELQGRAKTLSNEIEYMNSQVNLTELRIQSSIQKIAKTEKDIIELGEDIDDMKTRIGKLEQAINYQKQVLSSRLRERYKSGESSQFFVLFGGNSLNELIQKSEYLKVMELQDKKLLDEMDETKNNYSKQKKLFEVKKSEEESLKAQLVSEKANLDSYKATLQSQKEEKDRLLKVTQNDESKYQKLLAEAKRELEQIINAVSVLKNQQSEKVEKGDAIGIQGNSGYSFGDHLHFGVYKYESFEDIDGWNWYYSNYVNPEKKLKEKTVYWDTGCESAGDRSVGDGDWAWPLKNPTISQGFGNTCWSKVYYGGKPHPAYDMYGSSGSIVYAADDGNAFYCRNCLGDGGNGVFIFHDDGYMTLYWHLK